MSAGKQKILVVEDEHGIADTLQFALRNEGFDPTCVATAEAALAWLGANSAALVILDIGLPDINGLDLFKQLRERLDVQRERDLALERQVSRRRQRIRRHAHKPRCRVT